MSEDIGRFTQTIRQLRIYVVIMLVVVVADVVGILRPIRGGLEYGLEITHGQVERLFEAVSVPWSTLTYWRSGVRRIADMEQRLAEVSVDYTRLKELEFENEQLKAVKGIVDQTTDSPRFIGRVVNSRDGISVDVGRADGITEGMVAVDGEGVLVGLVGAVSSHMSRVHLPVDQGERVGVRVVGEKTTGVLVGDGKRAMLEEVLQDEPLETGDILVTTGGEGTFPEGLVVAQVTELTGSPADVTKGAHVSVLASDLQSVLIY